MRCNKFILSGHFSFCCTDVVTCCFAGPLSSVGVLLDRLAQLTDVLSGAQRHFQLHFARPVTTEHRPETRAVVHFGERVQCAVACDVKHAESTSIRVEKKSESPI